MSTCWIKNVWHNNGLNLLYYDHEVKALNNTKSTFQYHSLNLIQCSHEMNLLQCDNNKDLLQCKIKSSQLCRLWELWHWNNGKSTFSMTTCQHVGIARIVFERRDVASHIDEYNTQNPTP